MTIHRGAPPRLVTTLAGGTAVVGAIVCAGAAVLMNLGDAPWPRPRSPRTPT